MRRRSFIQLGAAAGVAAALPLEIATAAPPSAAPKTISRKPKDPPKSKRITPAERQAAAKAATAKGLTPGVSAAAITAGLVDYIDPKTGYPYPHYFGPFANYANSPLPRGPIDPASIKVTSPGSGYSAAAGPVVTITDGGTGAQATAQSDVTGAIIGFTLVSGGSGYISPAVTITDAGGTATGATATATFDPLTGTITAIIVGTPGGGYFAPIVTITDAGVPGTGAQATAVVDTAGVVIAINLVPGAGGSGYVHPVVTITGAGTGATATAVVDTATGAITSFNVTNGGSGYVSVVATITDAYGTGSGATASVTLVNGAIGSVVVNTGGAGYTAPVVSFAGAGGTGTGATATATMSGGVITSVIVDNAGSGYVAPVTVTITNASPLPAPTLPATADATVVSDAVGAVTLVSPGANYSAPIITIAGNGTGATATASVAPALGTGIRKFMDSLPGLTALGANNLGQYIPVAVPDTVTFPGCHYYEIEVGQYTEQLHRDLPATTLRGYRQTNTADATVSVFRYLGPAIVATKGTPVRIKFKNSLPTGAGGDLFIPVDKTVMGAGMGPAGMAAVQSAAPVKRGSATIKVTTKAPLPLVVGGSVMLSGFMPDIYNGTWTVTSYSSTATQSTFQVTLAVVPAGAPTTIGNAGDPSMMEDFHQNRATLHLHGGLVPWISDGTPHQWTVPAGEMMPPMPGMPGMAAPTQYPKGVSVSYVPDMWFRADGSVISSTPGTLTPPEVGASNNPGDGSLTFYYNNEQSARLMFYHDHSYGITRLNVYAGEAAPYLLTDADDAALVTAGVIPADQIPLVIQDKTFVDAATVLAQDPSWQWYGTGPGTPVTGVDPLGTPFSYTVKTPVTGDLWVPNVFVPAQNPDDPTGANPYGRWQYGPWFWPPTGTIDNLPIANPYAGMNAFEPTMIPQMPHPSMGMEAFNDTPLVNGTAYPYLQVAPKPYRFRILNAANDRFLNLHMYVADPTVTTIDGRTNTEVRMVPALKTPGFPAAWSTDGRAGGVPDPRLKGPDWIQIGTEGGFLPEPVVIPPQPINWNGAAVAFNFGNVTDHSLLLGCAERADVIVDFSAYAGKTLILYNDAPAAFPALDPRYDYYTGNPDQMDTGGAPSTIAGFGPNTRTVMQIRVSAGTGPAFNLTALQNAFKSTAGAPGVFARSQDPIILPQAAYNSAYSASFPTAATAQFVQIHDTQKSFNPILTPITAAAPTMVDPTARTIVFQEKAAHDEMGAAYDTAYGRMSGSFGLELLGTTNLTQNIILYGYASPPVDLVSDSSGGTGTSLVPIGALGDGTQIWKITHNGVDTHPVHFHLFNVQLINRVAWDGALLPPDPNELGWKETVRMNPLESLIVAMRPALPPKMPFTVPNSVRLLDPTMPVGAVLTPPPGGFVDPLLNAVTVTNHLVDYGHEYVWHCHILSHEEMDMMHPLGFAVGPNAPTNPTAALSGKAMKLTWTDASTNETMFVVRVSRNGGAFTQLATVAAAKGTGTLVSYTDKNYRVGQSTYYQVVARTTIGDSMVYAGSPNGFPKISVDSAPLPFGPL